jgi:phage shock protein PspC (stress-responsive transcriptional regulator)
MRCHRSDGALLAGVCAGIARALGWNVWALRALFVLFLLFKPLWAAAAYALLAVATCLLENTTRGSRRTGEAAAPDGGLESPELAERSRRIADLERRFRDLENRGP